MANKQSIIIPVTTVRKYIHNKSIKVIKGEKTKFVKVSSEYILALDIKVRKMIDQHIKNIQKSGNKTLLGKDVI